MCANNPPVRIRSVTVVPDWTKTEVMISMMTVGRELSIKEEIEEEDVELFC